MPRKTQILSVTVFKIIFEAALFTVLGIHNSQEMFLGWVNQTSQKGVSDWCDSVVRVLKFGLCNSFDSFWPIYLTVFWFLPVGGDFSGSLRFPLTSGRKVSTCQHLRGLGCAPTFCKTSRGRFHNFMPKDSLHLFFFLNHLEYPYPEITIINIWR